MHAKSVHFNFNTAVLLRPVDSLSSKDVHCRALYRNLNLQPTTTVRYLHSKHRTFRSRSWPRMKENMFAVLSGLQARIIHVIVTFRTLTPSSLQSSILWYIFFRFLAPQRYFPISFGIKNPPRFKWTGRHFESVWPLGHILASVLPPQIRTLRQWRAVEHRDKLVREGRYGRTCLIQA